jgi:hypothetical protein
MTSLLTPSRPVADGQRARVVADAVVSAYINEIATPRTRPAASRTNLRRHALPRGERLADRRRSRHDVAGGVCVTS